MADRRRRRGLALLFTGAMALSLLVNSYPVMGKMMESMDSARKGSVFVKEESVNVRQLSTENKGKIHVLVNPGDTLWDIASAFNTTVDEIMSMNPALRDPALIKAGDELWVSPSSDDEISDPSRGENKVTISKEDLDLLAQVIYAEARGEDFEGQVAVGAVILNRVESPYFPKTVREVIYQPGAFTAVRDRQISLQPDEEAYKAAQAALTGQDPSNGALFYYNPRLATDKWIKTRTVVKTIGNHTFSI